MARLNWSVTTEGELALTAATAKTILQVLAPTNQRLALKSVSVSFDGTAADAEPVLVDLLRQTSAGTMTAATEVKEDGLGSEAIQGVGTKNATVEPTAGDVIRTYEVHPTSGLERVFGADEEILIPGAGRLGLRCNAPAGVNVVGHMSVEE
jgi:hypothetical protein